MGEVVLKLKGVCKEFPGVKALDGVDLEVREGEVMALLGENGAGKSTLMKCLTGVYQRDAGSIQFKGKEINYTNARQAQDDGISIIHQELNLIPKMKVYENIFLGRELKNKLGKIDIKQMYNKTAEMLKSMNVDLKPDQKICELSVAQQQMVEIAKALLLDTKVIVMDEPTDALTDSEVVSLFKIINDLRDRKKAVVYISHRLEEIFEICDRATILRDGAFIGEKKVSELTYDELISMMVGRKLENQFPYEAMKPGKTVLSVKNLSNDYVHDISFDVKAGEVLGVAGLVGAGRTELAKTLYGVFHYDKGTVELDGQQIHPKSPSDAIRQGIYYMTEDRKGDGLVLIMNVKENISLSSSDKITSSGHINEKKDREYAEDYVKKMRIKTPSVFQKTRNLSGGNQQKVILAKAMMSDPKVLILDEPTRGIDVGAKKEIYLLINELRRQGKAVIKISSEMPEILGMSDRIMILHEGKKKGELSREEATQEKIMDKILS